MKRLLMGAVILLSPAAHASDCVPPKLLNQVSMTPLPTGDGSLVESVPVSLNGSEAPFILDTGGIQTQISPALAARLHLPINRTSDALVDVTGQQAAGLAMIHDFTLGSNTRHDLPLPVSPNNVVPTGLLSLNDLTAYDAEMDFPGQSLKLYAPDHCPGVTALAPSAGVIPFSLRGGHITITALLDGKPLTAILDTGSTATNLPADLARDMFAVTPGAPDTPANGTLNGTSVMTYDHVFHELSFGPLALAAPHITIIPPGSGPQLIIGMNILKTQHLYFSFAEGKLYFAPQQP